MVAAFRGGLAFVAGQDAAGSVSGRLVSRAYQPSVAASASMAAWSKCQCKSGLPVSWSVVMVVRR